MRSLQHRKRCWHPKAADESRSRRLRPRRCLCLRRHGLKIVGKVWPYVLAGIAIGAGDDGVDLSAAVKSFEAAPFTRLRNATERMPGNASRTDPEILRV